ncbi:hypothetical protein C0991_004208 [Blastosporella zonata]|nr:hypothetical protein C0991_004208 [Blastosporella zonata]
MPRTTLSKRRPRKPLTDLSSFATTLVTLAYTFFKAMEGPGEPLKLSNILNDLSASISSTREGIQSLRRGFEGRNISAFTEASPPHLIFELSGAHLFAAAQERHHRGIGAGDLVDSMVEGRVVLEKIRTLEARMRYQIEKLVRVAEESDKTSNLVDGGEDDDGDTGRRAPYEETSYQDRRDLSDADALYRPPRVAPVPYNEKSKSQLRKERPPVPSALASLSSDASRPHIESTSGLGSTPSLASGRAAYLKRLNEFEEENFSRVVMKKSDARRRARDEEDLALGGSLAGGGGKHRRRAGGLQDEFGDVLRSVERVGHGGSGKGDGYDELRQRSKKADLLERSRQDNSRKRSSAADSDGGGERTRKKSRFELEAKSVKKRLNKGKSR